MISFEEIIKRVPNGTGISKREGELLFGLIDLEQALLQERNDKIEIKDNILLTPFYIDGDIYELYSYEMNLVFEQPSNTFNCESKGGISFWLEKLQSNLTLYKIHPENPYVPKIQFEKYFRF